MRIHLVTEQQFNGIEDQNGACNNQGLSHLQAIDARQDVDGICAEYRQHAHEDVVQGTLKKSKQVSSLDFHFWKTLATYIQGGPNQIPCKVGHNDRRGVIVYVVHHQQRQRGDGGQQELVAPSQVENVIGEAQEDHAANGKKGGNQFHELCGE